jgi:hypothetical protein
VNDVVLGRGYPRTVGIWNARVVAKRVGDGDVRRARRRRRRNRRNDNHRARCDRDATISGLRCGGRVRDDDEEDANGGGAGGKRGRIGGRRGERDGWARGGVERTRKHDERKGGGGSGVGRGGGRRGG